MPAPRWLRGAAGASSTPSAPSSACRRSSRPRCRPRPSAAAAPPGLPERDETALPFFTVDPAGSMDLDQAMHLERDGDGLPRPLRHRRRARPSSAGGALDRETRGVARPSTAPTAARRCTRRCSARTPRACCPDEARPAFVWDLRLDGDGRGAGRRGLPRDGAQRRAAGLRGRAGGGRRRHRRRAAAAAARRSGERRIALERRAWRREPADARAGGDDARTAAYRSASGRRCRPRTGTPRSR